MFYTNDAGYRWNTIWEKAAPWETHFNHFALALRLLSGYCFEISCDACNELFNVQKIPYIHNVMYTLEAVGSF